MHFRQGQSRLHSKGGVTYKTNNELKMTLQLSKPKSELHFTNKHKVTSYIY